MTFKKTEKHISTRMIGNKYENEKKNKNASNEEEP